MSEYSPSVRAALTEFVSDIELEGRHSTALSYHHMLKPLARLDLAVCPLITPSVCRELLAERIRTTTGSTPTTFFAVLRSFCRWCVEHQYLSSNPTDGIPKPKQRRPAHRWLTAEQLRAMYHACQTDADKLIMLLCGGSGLRAQELLTLKWSGVDFDRGEIRVLGKGKKWRTLAPGEMAMGVLAEMAGREEVVARIPRHAHFDQRAPTPDQIPPSPSDRSGVASTSRNHNTPFVMPYRTTDNLGYHVDQLAKRAGIAHCHPHMLRHSFAVNYLQSDGSAYGLQQLLGHANAAMTLFYTRDAAEELARKEQQRIDLGSKLFG